jgi:genome maintenance exonuclease 1
LKTRNGKNGSGRYYVVDETTGLAYPSVTTIISETSDKSGLTNWVKKVGQEEADRISKFSANRGTFMHSLHENYLDIAFINGEDKALQKAMKVSLEQNPDLTKEEIECGKDLFLNFFNNSDFYERIEEVMFQEIPLWSNKGGGYAGRMDLSIWGKGRIPKIIDFKTSRKPKREEWIEGYKKQIAAYSIAMYERHGIFPEECEIWISCETGDVQTFTMNQRDIREWFTKFYINVQEYHEKHPNN